MSESKAVRLGVVGLGTGRRYLEAIGQVRNATLAAICDVLQGQGENTIPAWEGAATVAVCEAIIRSADTGKPVKIKYPK